jgi:PP-loop superfamily ATP-utilizing enzyme
MMPYNIINYIAISADEKHRVLKNKSTKWEVKYPLVDWNVEKEEIRDYCKELGFDWGGCIISFRESNEDNSLILIG